MVGNLSLVINRNVWNKDASHEFFVRYAIVSAEGFICKDMGSIRQKTADEFGLALYNSTISLFTGNQFLFGAFLFNRFSDKIYELCKKCLVVSAFLKIVVCTKIKGLNSHLFPPSAGKDDKRDIYLTGTDLF